MLRGGDGEEGAARPQPAVRRAGAAQPADAGGALPARLLLLQVCPAGHQALHAEDAGHLDAGGLRGAEV